MFRNEVYDLEKIFDEFDDEKKVEFFKKYPFIWNDVFDIERDSRYHRAMKEIVKVGYSAALNDLQPKVEALIQALEYYTLNTNYNIVNEGRNYQDDYRLYEVDENTYDDTEIGTVALKAIAEFKHAGER